MALHHRAADSGGSSASSSIRLLQLIAISSIVSIASSQRQINGVASPGNYIHTEQDVDLGVVGFRAPITIDSPVPVTIQRFSDSGSLEGQQSVTSNMAKVLVTSDCDTSETTLVPIVTTSTDGSTITVTLDDTSGNALAPQTMSFLDPSSYSAAWRWVSELCGLPAGGIPTPPTVQAIATPLNAVNPSPPECQTGPAANVFDDCQIEGEFCRLDMGVCNDKSLIHFGSCDAMANYEVCTEEYDPVCGCDNVSYSNSCVAYGAGVSVSRMGLCNEPPPPITTVAPGGSLVQSCLSKDGTVLGDEGSCQFGNFCQLEPGVCGNTASAPHGGVCVPTSDYEACITLYQPVCGCNGETYSNDCAAYRAGVSILRPGECDQPPTTPAAVSDGRCQTKSGSFTEDHDGSCQAGEFCKLAPEVCSSGEEVSYGGFCTAIADFEVCSFDYAPVCGCDKITYSNECAAYKAGVSVSRKGACEEPPAGIVQSCQTKDGTLAGDDGTCQGGQLCRLEPNVCSSENQPPYFGECAPMLLGCPESYEPVCGCDAKTYNNECFANGAGVSVSHEGECKENLFDPAPTVAANSCEMGMCLSPEGVCEVEVNCFANPCDVSNTCEDGEVCESNYCGGCHAVCTPTNNLIDPGPPVSDPLTCDAGEPCLEIGSTCTKGTETCCGQTFESFKCTCGPSGMDGQLQYNCYFSDACMVPSCCMSGPPSGKPPTAAGTCNVGELCDTGIPDDYCCFDMQGGTGGTYCSVSGGKVSQLIQGQPTTTAATTVGIMGTTTEASSDGSSAATTAATTTEASSDGSSAATTVAITTEASSDGSSPATTGATTTEASSDGSSAATTAANIITGGKPLTTTGATTTAESSTTGATTTSFAAIDGDFPTEAPSMKFPTARPTTWWQAGPELPENPNSAFFRPKSMSAGVATAFMAIALVSVIFPGNGANNNLWGFGKVAVAAMAVSSIYSKSPHGAIRKRNQDPKQLLPQNNKRTLQGTCTYNVEVLLDGCAHSAEINAPAGRIIDVSIDDKTSQQDPSDNCITDYNANLNFPAADTIMLNLQQNKTAPGFDQFDFRCMRAVIGRPFVDATGGSIQAMPLIPDSKQTESCASSLSWAGNANALYTKNATTSYEHLLMGEDWTQRALGEHSSVASFSAFSIALMTNQAPSDLVEAALKAGLDEVRHAKISFDIASKLTGKEVGPGPLPHSSHEFGQDMTALALAVAREGCVDETLSAFAAALEVEHINAVLDEGLHDTLYSNIDRDSLAFIRDALVIIAMDESNHSALAWRTLNWVCDVDSYACESVHSDVFEGSSLERRFNQRAESPFGDKDLVLRSMGEEWSNILNAHRLALSSLDDESVCKGGTGKVGEDHSQSLLASVTENILHQVSCN